MPTDFVLDTDPDETQEWLDSIDALVAVIDATRRYGIYPDVGSPFLRRTSVVYV